MGSMRFHSFACPVSANIIVIRATAGIRGCSIAEGRKEHCISWSRRSPTTDWSQSMASRCESMWPFNKPSRPNSGFLDLTQITVARRLAEEARAHLREVGRSGYEGFALWVGVRADQGFIVQQTIIPA